MASKDYLFVNKDSRSPSLSRNTGSEASLASRVNKHVQQQRFWKSSGPRRSWYRPFVRSDSSSSAPSPTQSETPTLEETTDIRRHISSDQQSPRLPKRSNSVRVSPVASKQGPRSRPQELPITADNVRSVKGRWLMPPQLLSLLTEPGNAVDAFNTLVVPLTPILVEVLQRHMKWAIAASITNYTVQDGVKRVLSVVLQDKMRAAAFLAMATAQQKRINALVFPNDQGPELYSYRATKMIREHIESHQGMLPSYTLVDIFRLAQCEWTSGNHNAARIHFSYVSKLWDNFEPQDSVDHHIQEFCSSEDIFFAIDADEKPLLTLNWLASLFTGPQPLLAGSGLFSSENNGRPTADSGILRSGATDDTWQLEQCLRKTDSPLLEILDICIANLRKIPAFRYIDFGSALTGPLWVVKRGLHATLHRLQSLDLPIPSTDDSIRRTLVIVLLLASTTPERRIARMDMEKLAERLEKSLESIEKSRHSVSAQQSSAGAGEHLQDPRLWLWMYVAGFAATRESHSQNGVRQWFVKRALLLTVRLCGPSASSSDIQKIVLGYLYFESALGGTVEALAAAVASHSVRQENSTILSARNILGRDGILVKTSSKAEA